MARDYLSQIPLKVTGRTNHRGRTDGPFVAAQPDQRRNWVGSSNQRFHYMTSRYTRSIETAFFDRPAVEVRVGLDEHLLINGFPMVHSPEPSSKQS